MADELNNRLLLDINSKLDQLLYLKPLVERHDAELYGNGDEGIVVRVDRMEQTHKRQVWFLGLALPGIVSAIVEFLRR